jgi:hypothetical protein
MGDHGRRDVEPVDPAILGVSEKYIPELLKHTRQPFELVRFPQEEETYEQRKGARPIGVSPTSIAGEIREEHRRRLLGD